ncbi:hypothetical protein SD70_10040 [Gordoniibacillus kamchatkensis]|uniref:Calcineurin-like phosphoesterase domain-containing protein n=1 Tax=Gordoniibacillus kamchatkensis TaxID=1590651 RepID=A0ABR5AKA3_9BACL|nr:metallophosphoesterase [Paenibacillus sp. VKM B-2647]KIL40960.1 hypothetical protein SD70_10040 [Paenibacillus sp. VKM B-2647]
MRIRIMTDLHYTHHAHIAVRDSFYRAYLQKFFEDGPEADLYVSLGDLTQNGTESEYRSVYGMIDSFGRRASFVHIPGNHDLLEANAAQTESWAGTPPIRDGFGCIENDLAVLVFLNSCQARKPHDWGGRLNDVQTELLRRKQAEANGRPLLVFAHHPLPNTTALSDVEMMRVEEAASLLAVMSEAPGPCLWFNGHNHIQSIVRKRQWTYVQTASAICLPCWREVAVTGGAVTVTTATVDDPAIRELAAQSLTGFGGFHRVPPAQAAGEDQDRSAIIHL